MRKTVQITFRTQVYAQTVEATLGAGVGCEQHDGKEGAHHRDSWRPCDKVSHMRNGRMWAADNDTPHK